MSGETNSTQNGARRERYTIDPRLEALSKSLWRPVWSLTDERVSAARITDDGRVVMEPPPRPAPETEAELQSMLCRVVYRVPERPPATDLDERPVVHRNGAIAGLADASYAPETEAEASFAQRQGLRPLYGE